jgi:hypothetical protein
LSKNKLSRKHAKADGKLKGIFADFLFGVLFDPENGGYIFLRKVELSPNCKELEAR